MMACPTPWLIDMLQLTASMFCMEKNGTRYKLLSQSTWTTRSLINCTDTVLLLYCYCTVTVLLLHCYCTVRNKFIFLNCCQRVISVYFSIVVTEH